MIYVVDRIEENIVVLENIKTKDIINIKIDNLPNNLKEGNILKYENNKYILDNDLEKIRRDKIKEKFDKLRKV